METTIPNIETPDQKTATQIKLVLDLLKTFVGEFSGEIDLSKEMLEGGALTVLSGNIEKTIKNPLLAMLELSNNIDNNVKNVINQIAVSFLRSKAEIIEEVYRSKTNDNVLYYSIVLKKDDSETRDNIFSFYDKYDLLEISSKYPVHFQFVPNALIGKIYNTERIDVAKS